MENKKKEMVSSKIYLKPDLINRIISDKRSLKLGAHTLFHQKNRLNMIKKKT